MAFYEDPSGVSFYRSKDPVQNFRIRITMRRVVLGAAWSSGAPVQGLEEHIRTRQQERCYVFAWQEKVYSKNSTSPGIVAPAWTERAVDHQAESLRRELRFLTDPKNCVTMRQKTSHNAVMAMTAQEKSRHGQRLFSYIDADAKEAGKGKEPLVDDSSVPESYLADRVRQLRPRKARIGDVSGMQRVGDNVFGFPPSSRRSGNVPFTVMYLMADLSPSEREPLEDDEYLLCAIRIDADGLIAVDPDFSWSKKPYLIQVEKGTREMYEYFVEHASEPMSRLDIERERQLFQTLYQRHHESNALRAGSVFNKVPRDVIYHTVIGEIVSGEGFEFDNIFIHFLLHVPAGWTATWDGEETSHLSTQMTQRTKDKTWVFSCPFAWTLTQGPDNNSENSESNSPAWPEILFEVASLDGWNRYRTEGYGYLSVPLSTGCGVHEIHTWRPIGYRIVSSLRRFFIGGSPELEDLTNISVPTDFQGKELSKYGVRTTPSGRITVRTQVLSQHEHMSDESQRRFAEKPRRKFVEDTTADRGVEHVLEAFRRARQRLLAARGVPSRGAPE